MIDLIELIDEDENYQLLYKNKYKGYQLLFKSRV